MNYCLEVMARGAFPYAHLDLMLMPDDAIHLLEINLRGGLRGAKISGQEYQQRIAAVHLKILENLDSDAVAG
jgi:ribosomal protein S6--L-glutamate ligase